MIGLPRADRIEIREIVNRRDGIAKWGMRELLPGELHADPGMLFERLFPDVISLLNELMSATPVEALTGVAHKPEDLERLPAPTSPSPSVGG
jgi:hypothetical protein